MIKRILAVAAYASLVLVLCFITYLLLVSPFIEKVQDEVEYCDINGDAYKNLEASHADWLKHFAEGGVAFNVPVADPPAGVFAYTTVMGTKILFVEVDRGHHWRDDSGKSGYIYTPTGEMPNMFSIYWGKIEMEYLDGNIYCYKVR